MWCKHCRQDTPRISTASRHGMCCGRCGAPLSGAESSSEAPEIADPIHHPAEVGLDLNAPPSATASFADWQLDQSVRSLQARLEPWRGGRSTQGEAAPPSKQKQWRLDAAHAPLPRAHKPKRRAGSESSSGRSPSFTNSALLLGLAAAVGGVGVLGYSVMELRSDYWNVGLSASVAGGVVFLLGLVLQLERIWHSSRLAVHKLRQIDAHLQDLERTTASLGVTHGTASQTFYTHMAEGAHPHLMLADLKGQIDLLSKSFATR